ncbi:MAG: hypothetical protein IMW90_19040 [Thermogemmatispora sp.]|jgi:hypothetical protein|uniref:hypothetical protein n=1 Tax=Thermogemmatispora TaxID=768669 RepID=UPI00147812ED|nr:MULTISPECIES: hypothetical protein [Thermogemmatispora]MBE3567819.1 hypothetical protein [Thermogemmatispora sp.]
MSGGSSPAHESASARRHAGRLLSGWTVRLLVAFVISWLLLLAFFASGAVSH